MNVLIIGDSFVEGVGATNKHGWAHRLAGELLPHRFVISGAGGDNINKLLARLPELGREVFDVVILQIGLNDSRFRPSLQGHEVTIGQFQDGIRQFVKFFCSNSATRFVLLGLTRVDEKRTAPYKEDKSYLNRDIDIFDAEIRRLAGELAGSLYVPMPPLNDDLRNLTDGLHPSDQGHTLILNSVRDALAASNLMRGER